MAQAAPAVVEAVAAGEFGDVGGFGIMLIWVGAPGIILAALVVVADRKPGVSLKAVTTGCLVFAALTIAPVAWVLLDGRSTAVLLFLWWPIVWWGIVLITACIAFG